MVNALYIHIPFCIRKCLYCDFLSIPFDRKTAGKYVQALCTELSLKKNLVTATSLDTIYIGGGTPTLLDIDEWTILMNGIRKQYHISPDAEITVEANPESVSTDKLEKLRELGINRLSIGIQSLQARELEILGRIHSADEAIEAVHLAGHAGLQNISLDLIYGIPGQTMNNWKDSLSRLVMLEPAHISTYELTVEGNTPLAASVAARTILLPDEDLVIDMYCYAIDYLSSRGYHHYEVSNFCLPGIESRHNLNYWDRGEYIGAGAGAHSFTGRHRTSNTTDINRYIHDLEQSKAPEDESVVISPEEAVQEFIFLGLRKRQGIKISDAEDLGLDIVQSSRELIDQGYLESDDVSVRLTRKGLILSNTVIVRLLDASGL